MLDGRSVTERMVSSVGYNHLKAATTVVRTRGLWGTLRVNVRRNDGSLEVLDEGTMVDRVESF